MFIEEAKINLIARRTMTSSFLASPKKCNVKDKAPDIPDPGQYEDGITNYREKYHSGGNKTNLVQGKAPRFQNKKDIDQFLHYKGLLDRHKYTSFVDNLTSKTGISFDLQISRDKISYLKNLSLVMEAKRLGLPPEDWNNYGKLGYTGKLPPDPAELIMAEYNPEK